MLRRTLLASLVAFLAAGRRGLALPRMRAQPVAPKRPSAYDARDDVFYHIMPIAWRYGTPAATPTEEPWNIPLDVARERRFGNFQGMVDGLPYLQRMGFTGVWLNPVFPSDAYHGYQHGRADRINPWFGTEDEFLGFVDAAKAAGVKTYIDLVAYGISRRSEWYRTAAAEERSPERGMFGFGERRRAGEGYTFKTWNGATVGFANWNLHSREARDLVIAWSKKWLDPRGDGSLRSGVAGFRLDHVWKTYDKPLNYDIDTFWREWRSEIEKVNPGVFTFAEQAKWESHGAELLATGDGENAHDAAFTKPFEFAAREALLKEEADRLHESMTDTLAACPKGRTLMAILGDHDVDRLSTAVGADVEARRGRERAAAAVLLLQPFPPVVWQGDEIGMLGKAASTGSDANDIPRREPFKWLARAGAPMTDYHRLHEGVSAAMFSKDNDGRSVEEQEGKEGSLLETYRSLIALRRESVALRRGGYERIECGHRGAWVFVRRHEEQTLLCAVNLTGERADLAARLDGAPGLRSLRWTEAGGAEALRADAEGVLRIGVAPYGRLVLQGRAS